MEDFLKQQQEIIKKQQQQIEALLNEQQNIGLSGVLTSCGIEKKKTTNRAGDDGFGPGAKFIPRKKRVVGQGD